VHIGEGCDIGPYVSIFPGTSIGNEVQVDPFTLISGSVVYDAVSIGSHCNLSRSLVGRNTILSSSCQMDSGPAQIISSENIFQQEDIGAIIGPGSHLEAGVTVRPGVMVGNGCRVHAGTTLRETLKSRMEAF
jgi:glucose-1-phosphate thymidylyltransferase